MRAKRIFTELQWRGPPEGGIAGSRIRCELEFFAIFLCFTHLIERYLAQMLNIINISEVRYFEGFFFIFFWFFKCRSRKTIVTFHFFLLFLNQARDNQTWLIKSCGKEEVDFNLRKIDILDKCKYDVKKYYTKMNINMKRFVFWFVANYKKRKVSKTYYISASILFLII